MKRSGPAGEIIAVYICSCGSYYGASSMGKLEELERDRCPYCNGKRQKRYAQLIPKDEQTKAENEARLKLDPPPPITTI